jgi:hypothetical protein
MLEMVGDELLYDHAGAPVYSQLRKPAIKRWSSGRRLPP